MSGKYLDNLSRENEHLTYEEILFESFKDRDFWNCMLKEEYNPGLEYKKYKINEYNNNFDYRKYKYFLDMKEILFNSLYYTHHNRNYFGDYELIKYILDDGKRFDITKYSVVDINNDYLSLFLLSFHQSKIDYDKRYTKIIKLLLDFGFCPNNLSHLGNIDVSKFNLVTNALGQSILDDIFTIINLFIDYGGWVNQVDVYGTPLMFLVKLYLKSDSNYNQRTKNLFKQLFKLYINNKANPYKRIGGVSAYDIIVENNIKEFKDLID